MNTEGNMTSRNSRTRKMVWIGLLCLFVGLSVAHQVFPGDDALVASAQGTLPEVFYTFIPFVN